MIGTTFLIVSLWLMFNLFLFAWLGAARSAALWNSTVDRFNAAVARERRV